MNSRQAAFSAAFAMLLLWPSFDQAVPQLALPSVAEDPAVILADARSKMKQGMLFEAKQRLMEVPADAPATVRASTELLLGNVAFERGDYLAAESRYEAAAALYASEVPASEEITLGLRAAQANHKFAQELLARRLMLDVRSNRLVAATLALLVVAVTVVLYARRVLT